MIKTKGWKAGGMAAIFYFSSICGGVSSFAYDDGPWSAGFALSFPIEAGQTKNVLEDGIGFDVNFGYREPEKALGVRFDVIYESFLLDDAVIRHIQNADSGYASTWGLGGSALLTPPNAGAIKPYIYGGPGIYYVRAEATRYGVGNGYICDPWWGCYPAYGPAEYGVAYNSTTKLGFQGGVGLGFHFDGGGALVLDFQYVNINTTHKNTEFMPINIGYTQRF